MDGIVSNEKTEQPHHFPRQTSSQQLRYATFVLKATALIAVIYWLLIGIGAKRGLPRELTTTPYFGKIGAVATESAICSQIGANILKRGGNAADAVCIYSYSEKLYECQN